MKTSKRDYIPICDSRTSRLETVAFLGLGLAGAVLITTAVTNSLHFAESREAIVQAWSAPGPAQAELAGRRPGPAPTNVLRVHAATTQTHADSSPGIPESPGSEVLSSPHQIRMAGAMPLWKVEPPR